MLSNPGGSVQWPKGRQTHSCVLINNSTGPHLLVVGGSVSDFWLFDINKRIWKELVSIINTVTSWLLPLSCRLIYQTLSLGDGIILSRCGV